MKQKSNDTYMHFNVSGGTNWSMMNVR